jgi:hypothetical protein
MDNTIRPCIRTYIREELEEMLSRIRKGLLTCFTEDEINYELQRRNYIMLLQSDKVKYPDLSHS